MSQLNIGHLQAIIEKWPYQQLEALTRVWMTEHGRKAIESLIAKELDQEEEGPINNNDPCYICHKKEGSVYRCSFVDSLLECQCENYFHLKCCNYTHTLLKNKNLATYCTDCCWDCDVSVSSIEETHSQFDFIQKWCRDNSCTRRTISGTGYSLFEAVYQGLLECCPSKVEKFSGVEEFMIDIVRKTLSQVESGKVASNNNNSNVILLSDIETMILPIAIRNLTVPNSCKAKETGRFLNMWVAKNFAYTGNLQDYFPLILQNDYNIRLCIHQVLSIDDNYQMMMLDPDINHKTIEGSINVVQWKNVTLHFDLISEINDEENSTEEESNIEK